MDNLSSTPLRSKQQASLSDLLQEEQEPFVLESYLFQKGYRYCREDKSLINSESSSYGCFPENKCCNSKRVGNKSRRLKDRSRSSSISAAPGKCLNIARRVLKRIVLMNKIEGAMKCTSQSEDEKPSSSTFKEEPERRVEERHGSDIWSEDDDGDHDDNARYSTQCGFEEAEKKPSIYTGHLNHLQPNEAILLWKILEQNRDCGPVSSVLDQIENAAAPVDSDVPGKISVMKQQQTSSVASGVRFPVKRAMEEEIVLSPSLWELLVWSPTENPDGGVVGRRRSSRNDCCFEYINSNKGWQHLESIDYVESNTRKEKKRLTLPGEIIACGESHAMIKSWRKGHGKRMKKLTQLLVRSELAGLLRECCALLEGFGREIGKEVVEGILEGIVDELVEEMVLNVLVGNG